MTTDPGATSCQPHSIVFFFGRRPPASDWANLLQSQASVLSRRTVRPAIARGTAPLLASSIKDPFYVCGFDPQRVEHLCPSRCTEGSSPVEDRKTYPQHPGGCTGVLGESSYPVFLRTGRNEVTDGVVLFSPRRLTIFAVTPVYSLSWPQQKGLALTITEPVPICYPAGLTAAEKRANANLTVASTN